VGHGAGGDDGAVDLDRLAVVEVDEVDVAVELLGRHREVRRPQELPEGVAQAEIGLGTGGPHGEVGAGGQHGHEEREPLDVVPVDVGDEGVTLEGAVGGLGLAEEPQAGAQVEDDRRPAGALDRDAGGVAAVAAVGIARTGGRTSDSPERDVDHVDPLGTCT
jgi:hypothetical protein